MPQFQIKKTSKAYDVCIVGSGAGGGMAAYVLANAGIKVVLLEAGPLYDPAKNVTQLKWPWESPRRGAPIPRAAQSWSAAPRRALAGRSSRGKTAGAR